MSPHVGTREFCEGIQCRIATFHRRPRRHRGRVKTGYPVKVLKYSTQRPCEFIAPCEPSGDGVFPTILKRSSINAEAETDQKCRICIPCHFVCQYRCRFGTTETSSRLVSAAWLPAHRI
jgi:hypothetical protein